MNQICKSNYKIIICYIILCLLPVTVLLCISRYCGATISELFPFWNDEVWYWRELYNFSTNVDLKNTGYLAFGSYIPRLGNMSTHGAGPFLLYGIPVYFLSLGLNSIVVMNTCYMCVALILMCLLIRPDVKTSLLVAGSIVMFLPYLLYAPSSMSETACYALMIIYVTMLFKMSNEGGKLYTAGVLFCLFILSIYRINHIVLFLPPIFLCDSKERKRTMILFSTAGIITFFTSVYLIINWQSPYPWGHLYSVFQLPKSEMIKAMYRHAVEQLKTYLSSNDLWHDWVYKLFYLLACIACVVATVYERVKRRGFFYMSMSIVLLSTLIGLASMYRVDTDTRSMMPVFFFSLLAMIMWNKSILRIIAVCAEFLILFITFTKPAYTYDNQYWIWHYQSKWAEGGVHFPVADDELLAKIVYDRDATSRWDNTIYIWEAGSHRFYCGLPKGIGIVSGPFPEASEEIPKWLFWTEAYEDDRYTLIYSDETGYLYQRAR